MGELKVGDKVKRINEDNTTHIPVGARGTVTDADDHDGMVVVSWHHLDQNHAANKYGNFAHCLQKIQADTFVYPASVLPADAAERKAIPVGTGVLDYFTSALIAVAKVSKKGNDQHNPGLSLRWTRGKSTDHADTLIRHYLERGTNDTDGVPHSAKMAWRALALLQQELEDAGAPVSRGSK